MQYDKKVYIEAAKYMYDEEGYFEIDTTEVASEVEESEGSPEGVWVKAYVFIAKDEVEGLINRKTPDYETKLNEEAFIPVWPTSDVPDWLQDAKVVRLR